MKVVFLDFDGVLNSEPYLDQVREKGLVKGVGFRDPSDRHMLDPERIALLNGLLERTGAMVVISSSWRQIYRTDELTEFLSLQGFAFPERIIGRTPQKLSHIPRGVAIQMWLEENPQVQRYVALDDDDEAGLRGTVWVQTNCFIGLTLELVEKAVEILNAD